MYCFFLFYLMTVLFYVESNCSDDWNVDNVIEKLLASENFNKLTEMIAMKTAEKINARKNNFYQNQTFFPMHEEQDHNESENNNIKFSAKDNLVTSKFPDRSKLSLKYKLFTKLALKKLDKQNYNFKTNEKKGNDLNKVTKSYSKNILKQELKVREKMVNNEESLENHNDFSHKEDSKEIQFKSKNDSFIDDNPISKKDINGNIKLKNHLNKDITKNISSIAKKETKRRYVLQTSSDYDEYHKEVNKTRQEELSTEHLL